VVALLIDQILVKRVKMTSTILSDQQKAALYDLRFSPEEVMLLNEKPELAEKIISLASTNPPVFFDIKAALFYCKFSPHQILDLLKMDVSGDLLRRCLNHARRFQGEGILSQIGHEQIIKLVNDQQNGHRSLWGHSLGVSGNVTQNDSGKCQSLLSQAIYAPTAPPFDEIDSLEHFLLKPNTPISSFPSVYQQTDKEWLAAVGYNNQQIVGLVNHPLRETFITALKNLHYQLITEFTHEEIVFIIKNKGVIILDLIAQLGQCGFRKQMIWMLVITNVNLGKFERLNKYAPMLLKQQFTQENLIYLLLKDKEEFLLELFTHAHPFLTEVLGFTNTQVKQLAMDPEGVEILGNIQKNYESLIGLGITKKELSQVGAQLYGRGSALALLECHMELYQLQFSPQDMLALARHQTGVQNIKAVLHYRNTSQETYFINRELIIITARNWGSENLSTICRSYNNLRKLDFSHEQILDLASRTVADIETIAQFDFILRQMGFMPCQILEMLANPQGKEYLKCIASNYYPFLHAHNFQPNELYALAKISNGHKTINIIKKYYEDIHQYKFPFSNENLVTLLTRDNGVKIFEAINKGQDKLYALGFKIEELVSTFAYEHSLVYLNTIILRYGELRRLGFKKNHLILLASQSEAVLLLKATLANMKSFQEKQFLQTTSIDQIIELVLNERNGSHTISAVGSKRKIGQVTENVVRSYEKCKEKLIKAMKQLFPEENSEEVIVPIALAKALLVDIPCSKHCELGLNIENIDDSFYRITRNKKLFAQYQNKRLRFAPNSFGMFQEPAPEKNLGPTTYEDSLGLI
jgi:hypothetical protein